MKETKEYKANTMVTLSNGDDIMVEETTEKIIDLSHDPTGGSVSLLKLTKITTLRDGYNNFSYLHETVYVSVNHIVKIKPIS